MNEPMTIVPREIEIAHLELKYEHTRIRNEKAVSRLSDSLSRYGQITPVIVVPGESPGHVLIDGYLRVFALRRCGVDTVSSHVFSCKEEEALIQVLARTQDRRWEIFEQAELIRELSAGFGMSHAEIAGFLGKDKSFVSRRLSLMEALDEETRGHVKNGHVSLWSAVRVLAPMARANPDHARTLSQNLAKDPIATRDLAVLFKHYQKANKKKREEMVNRPRVFLKALENRDAEKRAASLARGPEGKWLKDAQVVKHVLYRLKKESGGVFHENQSVFDRRLLLTAFKDAKNAFFDLEKAIRKWDDSTGNGANDPESVPKRGKHPGNRAPGQAFPPGDPAGNPGERPKPGKAVGV